jgi:ubiquinone biosynthesis protein COQ4
MTSLSLPPLAPSFSQRLVIALGALRELARDHGRLDQVLVFAQAANAGMVKRAVERLEAIPNGVALLADRPRIDRAHVDFDALRRLPDGSLGREYTRFLDENGIGPEPFEELPNVIDERAAWIMLRLRQTHDLWHVLTGYKPDVNGEILLQAFTYSQLGAPSALILALGGTLRWGRFSRKHVSDLRTAFRRGKATKFLATFRWEDHWSTPVSELRTRLACPPAN